MNSHEIEKYIETLINEELEFKKSGLILKDDSSQEGKISFALRVLSFLNLLFHSLVDFIQLYLMVRFGQDSLKGKKIVYTAKNFCNVVDGKLVDRVVRPLFTDNIIFINPSKEYLLEKINGQKVYNLGGLVKLLSYFYHDQVQFMRIFKAYRWVNNAIIKYLAQYEVYILWFYNLNSLSLIFSNFRQNITLIEVQHGSMVNYPPYAKQAPIKTADIFYVKNQSTIEYLKIHLCLNFPAEYRLIPYPKGNWNFVPGIHVLYASTIEFNGLHPIMKKFLADFDKTNLDLIVRLHPREKEKESLFVEQLEQYKVKYKFDRSENWLEGNTIENLVVVSPWSSSIEDSYDNGFVTIIIDPVGRERYKHLIDNQCCFYSDDLAYTISNIREYKNYPHAT
jgi:hypothetical protein